MQEIILAKYGEMALKGLNKAGFEDVLLKNIRRRLKNIGEFSYARAQSTVYITAVSDEISLDDTLTVLQQVFGIAALCKALVCEKSFESICERCPDYLAETLLNAKTFKVEAKRADKSFPMKSPEICMELGGILLEKFPHLQVDVHHPEVTVNVEIRDTHAYVHAGQLPGAGGLPVGTSGKALLLLSGGIDSPVAGYMMAKRGVHVSAIHFASPPYTSERARMKVEALAQKMAPYCGSISFFCVPFTEIQEAIKEHCPSEFFTVIMRRLMMEIAQKIAAREECLALVTGESVGQVASQTLQAIAATDAVCEIPVLRPLIGMDKTEIISISRKIDTFETSIQPYEDCCTVFTPKHPKVRPRLEDVNKAQAAFDFSGMVAQAVAGTEVKQIRANS